MPKKKDLTGQRFGRLTVLEPTGKRDGKGSIYWRCRCDCGHEIDVTQDKLVYGAYKSCGCLKREMQSQVSQQLHMVDGTCVEWLRSRKSRSDNTSGFRGVYRQKNGRYRVHIGFKGEKYYLGTYGSFQEAVKVREDAEERIHGGFLEAYETWKSGDGKGRPLVFDVEKTGNGFRIHTNIQKREKA